MIAAYAYTAPVGSAENGKGSPLRFPWLWPAPVDKPPDVFGKHRAGPDSMNFSSIMGFFAVVLASVNIAGGFDVQWPEVRCGVPINKLWVVDS